MATDWDRPGEESPLRFDDLAAWDAAYEHGEGSPGSAVIGLAFHCTLGEASPRIVRAMRLSDPNQRGFAFTAAGTAARLHGRLTPELYEALRAEGPGGFAEHAIRDTLTFVPFRELPPWFKRRKIVTGVRNKLESWWLRSGESISDVWSALRRHRF